MHDTSLPVDEFTITSVPTAVDDSTVRVADPAPPPVPLLLPVTNATSRHHAAVAGSPAKQRTAEALPVPAGQKYPTPHLTVVALDEPAGHA